MTYNVIVKLFVISYISRCTNTANDCLSILQKFFFSNNPDFIIN